MLPLFRRAPWCFLLDCSVTRKSDNNVFLLWAVAVTGVLCACRMTGFPTSALCIACALYHAQLPHSVWAEWLLYQSLALTCATHLLLSAHTLAGLLGRQGVFVIEKMPLPQQWGMLSHNAMRCVVELWCLQVATTRCYSLWLVVYWGKW